MINIEPGAHYRELSMVCITFDTEQQTDHQESNINSFMSNIEVGWILVIKENLRDRHNNITGILRVIQQQKRTPGCLDSWQRQADSCLKNQKSFPEKSFHSEKTFYRGKGESTMHY